MSDRVCEKCGLVERLTYEQENSVLRGTYLTEVNYIEIPSSSRVIMRMFLCCRCAGKFFDMANLWLRFAPLEERPGNVPRKSILV